MHKLYLKILALLGFVKRVTPMIDNSVGDIVFVFDQTIGRLDKLAAKKGKARERIDETITALNKEWLDAKKEEDKAAITSDKIKTLILSDD